MTNGKWNKRKGSNAERYFAKEFRNLGYDKCITARKGSKLYDDCGIDLMFLPFLVQVKAGYARAGLNTAGLLKSMIENVKQHFPSDAPEQGKPKLVIWRKDVGRGHKRNKYHDLVYVSREDLVSYFKNHIDYITVNNILSVKKDVICMAFEDFKVLVTKLKQAYDSHRKTS